MHEERKPTISKINNQEFEINWCYNNPESKKVCVFVDGVRKVQKLDFQLKFIKGFIVIIFNEPLIDENVEVEIF